MVEACLGGDRSIVAETYEERSEGAQGDVGGSLERNYISEMEEFDADIGCSLRISKFLIKNGCCSTCNAKRDTSHVSLLNNL